MSLRDAIVALCNSAPPGTLVPVDGLRAMLEKDETPDIDSTAEVTVDLTVPEVAQRFRRGASTIRTWCESGQLVGAYRLNGREWRIPSSAIVAMQRTAASVKQSAKRSTQAPATDIGAWRNHLPDAQRATNA